MAGAAFLWITRPHCGQHLLDIYLEDEGALDDEVDDCRHPLRNHKRHDNRHGFAYVVFGEEGVEDFVSADVDEECDGVEHEHLKEAFGAGGGAEGPSSIDEVGGGGAENEADGAAAEGAETDDGLEEEGDAQVYHG